MSIVLRNKRSKSRPSPYKKGEAAMVNLLKQIQTNTSSGTAQQNPDTVIFPVLRQVRPYSVILSYESFVVNSTTVPTPFAYAIQLNYCNGYADYVSAFDKYRILEVQAEFMPNNAGLTYIAGGSALTSTVIDYDDSNLLASGDQYAYDSCYTVNTYTPFRRTFVPRAALAAYSGAFTSYAQASAGQWLDCASPSVAHFGIKGVIGPSTPVFALNVVFRVHIQFANQH
jgi:hypothetical protein